jgi:hypothetical protein
MNVRRMLKGFGIVAALAAGAIGYWVFKERDAIARPGLTGKVRTAFVDAAVKTCEATQQQHPENKSIPVIQLLAYCRCYADALADVLSADDVMRAAGMAEALKTEKLKTLINRSSEQCAAAVQGR